MRYLLLVLIAIIFAAACAGTQAAGNGVAITSFSFMPTNVLSGQKAVLTLDIQNLGSFDASGIFVFLSGLGSDWTEKGVSVTNEKVFMKDSPYSLTAPKAEQKIEGEPESVSWVLTAPTGLAEGQTFSFNAIARVCYPYKTTAKARVEILSEEEWLSQKGGVAQKAIEATVSNSPLTISFESKQPLIAPETQFLLKLNIKNIGGGTAMTIGCENFAKGLTQEEVQQIAAFSLKIGTKEATCSFPSGQSVELKKGESKDNLVITCNIGSADIGPKATRDIELTLEYNYFIESKTSISVEGYTGAGAAVPAEAPATTTTTTPTKEEYLPGPCTPATFKCQDNKVWLCYGDGDIWKLFYNCANYPGTTCSAATGSCKSTPTGQITGRTISTLKSVSYSDYSTGKTCKSTYGTLDSPVAGYTSLSDCNNKCQTACQNSNPAYKTACCQQFQSAGTSQCFCGTS